MLIICLKLYIILSNTNANTLFSPLQSTEQRHEICKFKYGLF